MPVEHSTGGITAGPPRQAAAQVPTAESVRARLFLPMPPSSSSRPPAPAMLSTEPSVSKHRQMVKVTTAVTSGSTPSESTPPKSSLNSTGASEKPVTAPWPEKAVTPMGMPSSVTATMPMSMAPLTVQAMSTPVISTPRRASNPAGEDRSPSPMAPPSARMSPALNRPMRAMNMPRPALMAFFMEGGMQAIIISRSGVSVTMRYSAPEINTTASPCCQV